MYSGGSKGLQVNNRTATVEFQTFNASSSSNLEFSIRLASFSGTSGNGADGSDYVKIFVSTNGGSTYSEELIINGNSNARWSFSSGSGEATKIFSGDNSPTTFSPSSGGDLTTEGFSTLKISGLPSSLELRIKIELKNNSRDRKSVV